MADNCATWRSLYERGAREAAQGALAAGRWWKAQAAAHTAVCVHAKAPEKNGTTKSPLISRGNTGIQGAGPAEPAASPHRCDWQPQPDDAQRCTHCRAMRYPTLRALLAP